MSRSLAGPIAAFELGRQLRSPPFWIVLAISALMVFGAVTVERIQIGPRPDGPRNGSTAIAVAHLVWSLFFLFTTTALVADAVVADERTGFAPILRATPTRERDHLLGRFAGAFAACLLCFVAVPVAFMAGTGAPWLDPARIEPFRPEPYLFAFTTLALPNLFAASAISFALATRFHSAMAGYLGSIALLVLYDLGSGPALREPVGPLAALLEPFGFAAYARATADLEPGTLPSLAGPLGANRLLWLAVGAACLAWSVARYRWREPAGARPELLPGEEPARTAFPVVAVRTGFGPAALATQLWARLRLEIDGVARNPAFGILLLIGLGNAVATLSSAPPTTGEDAAARLTEAFRLVPVAVTIVFAGELVWGERDRRLHEVVGSAPIPDWALLAPKVAALALVLAALVAASALAAMTVLLAKGAEAGSVAAIARAYALPAAFDWTLVAILAVFLQALAPGKLAGWGYMVLYLIAALTMENLGLTGSLYRYGGHPDLLVSGGRPLWGWSEAGWVRLYWSCLALALLSSAFVLVGRGTDTRLQPRLARLRRAARGPAGWTIGVSLAAFAVLGVALGGAGVR